MADNFAKRRAVCRCDYLHLVTLLTAIFLLLGGVSVFTGVHPKKDTRHKGLIVAFTYIGIAALSVLVTYMVQKGIISVVFVQGQGPTALRQAVLGIMMIMSTISGLLLVSVYFFSRAKILYWYSLAMFLFTTAAIAYIFAKSVGTPIAWLGRSGLYFAGIYLLMAVTSASRELRVRGRIAGNGIANLFRHHLESLVEERTMQLSRAKEELEAAHAKLEVTVEDRTAALRTVRAQNELLQTVQLAQAQFISRRSSEELFQDLLHNLLVLTKSEFGFIGEVLYTDDGRMYLRDHAITDISGMTSLVKFIRNSQTNMDWTFTISGTWMGHNPDGRTCDFE